ncbi:hypothetical protein BD309DRAFT_1081578 [Dichomitus squalens]|nr:hypothetical protein BD309DRAFT_1081578 [Dichomitus squalens]
MDKSGETERDGIRTCTLLHVKILRLHGLVPADWDSYVQVKVGCITKKTQRSVQGDHAYCDETLEFPLFDTWITFRAITRKSPGWTHTVIGEHQEDMALLYDADEGQELSRTLHGPDIHRSLRIDFSLMVEIRPFKIEPIASPVSVEDLCEHRDMDVAPLGGIKLANPQELVALPTSADSPSNTNPLTRVTGKMRVYLAKLLTLCNICRQQSTDSETWQSISRAGSGFDVSSAVPDDERDRGEAGPRQPVPNIVSQPDSAPSPSTGEPMRDPSYKWRLIDANIFVSSGVLKLVQVSSLQEKPFVAISYRWTKAVTDWRAQIVEYGNAHDSDLNYETKLALGSLFFSTLTLDTLIDDASAIEGQRFLAQIALNVMITGYQYFWMDIVCIDQDVLEEKQFFVSKMGTLYSSAAATHAYPTGTSPLSTLESPELYFPIWESRAWTLQEQILSRSVTFVYLFEGDMTDEVIGLTPSTTSTSLPPWALGGRMVTQADGMQTESGMICVLWQSTEHITTCVLENESWDGGLPTHAFFGIEIERHQRWDNSRRAIGRTSLYKSIFALRQGTSSPLEKIRTPLMLHGGRQATLAVDMLYSILGILDMGDFPVSYSLSAEDARLAVFEAMPSQTLASVLCTDWGPNISANRDSALPRIYNSHPIVGITMEEVTITDAKFSRTIGTTMRARTERFRVWKDVARRQSRSLGVMRGMMGGDSRLMILFATSLLDNPHCADLDASTIPDKDLKVIVLDGSMTMTDEEYLDEGFLYDTTMEFVEIGVGILSAGGFPMDKEDMHLNTRSALLCFGCKRNDSGALENQGTRTSTPEVAHMMVILGVSQVKNKAKWNIKELKMKMGSGLKSVWKCLTR